MSDDARHAMTPGRLFARPPALPVVLIALAVVFLIQHGGWLKAPFFGDDFLFIDRLRGVSLFGAFAPRDLDHGYRPWSQGVHYWTLLRFAATDPLVFHAACGALWVAAMAAYFALVRRIGGAATAVVAVCGATTLAAWGLPLEWAAGAQDLWMLLFALLALLAFAMRRSGWAALVLGLALFSKETAAVVPVIALTLAMTVDRDSFGPALRRTLPLLVVTLAWAIVHPLLAGHLWWARAAVPSAVEVGAPVGLARSLLALINLDLAPAPLAGWVAALSRAVLVAVLLAGLTAWATAAAANDPDRPPASLRSIARFGLAWMAIGWIVLLVRPSAWEPHVILLGALGAWITVGAVLVRRRWPAVVVVLVLALLGAARADTLSRQSGNVRLLHINETFLAHMQASLQNRFPVLQRHSRLFFTGIPSTAQFIRGPGDAPALRVWFADSTVRGGLWSHYAPRTPRDSVGSDFFFRLDSLAGWVEVTPGIENVAAARTRNRHWVGDHERLALMLAQAGSLHDAAEEYAKLSSVDPRNVDYAYLVGLCLEGYGDTLGAARWYGHAAQLPGADEQTRAKARELAALAARPR